MNKMQYRNNIVEKNIYKRHKQSRFIKCNSLVLIKICRVVDHCWKCNIISRISDSWIICLNANWGTIMNSGLKGSELWERRRMIQNFNYKYENRGNSFKLSSALKALKLN